MSRVVSCRSCEAPMVWTVTTNGKPMPVDADPVVAAKGFRLVDPDGAIVDLDDPQREDVKLRAVYVSAPESGERLYQSHHATCPQAAQWRR